MRRKRNVVIVLLIVLILIVVISFSLGLTKKANKQEIIEVGSYTQSNYETNNEINNLVEEEKTVVIVADNTDEAKNLLNAERIIVILPSEKNITEEINVEHIDLEEQTPIEAEEPTNTEESKTSSISDKKYYIKVNNEANVVTIFTKDSEGQYTVPVKAMICSTGTATPTSGIYDIKLRWEWLALFGDVYGHYSTQIVGNILFHSVPYLEKGNPASLEYWEYDKLGTSCSAGCVRLTVADAKWIYDNIEQGTLVEFYSSSNPGPLRKTRGTKNIRK